MKISDWNSTLSCIPKCIRFVPTMNYKKIIFGLITFSFLGACTSPTAMLGPVYTFSSTNSVLHTGITYGSNEMITAYTGKTPIENLQEISSNQKNIKKKTLESQEFYILVKNKIEKTKGILKLSSQ